MTHRSVERSDANIPTAESPKGTLTDDFEQFEIKHAQSSKDDASRKTDGDNRLRSSMNNLKFGQNVKDSLNDLKVSMVSINLDEDDNGSVS